MLGLMQDWPLTVDRLLVHAARVHPEREIVTRRVDGSLHRTSYADIHRRAGRVSGALAAMGILRGDRVATLAWNSERHMECWYGAMGIGAVLHTLNPRLHPDQIAWIANDAQDRVLILDASFVPLVESLRGRLPVEHYVIIADRDAMPANTLGALCYEDWIAGHDAGVKWGEFEETAACGLCYTSGTTGKPKGVLYSHRSNVLHAMMAMGKDVLGVGADDVVMPVVPMFHANAWGMVFACPAAGASMVMPGSQLDGASLFELLDSEKVTVTAGVPTVWLGLLKHLQAGGLRLPHLRRMIVGGAALPEAILRAFEEDYGVEVVHAWGMTETSPIGTFGCMPGAVREMGADAQIIQKLKQGRPPFGVELKIVGDDGAELTHDGQRAGRLLVRGMAVAADYFPRHAGAILDLDGFFDTGDIATIDGFGMMKITDRAKDVIKSGGEWISSIELENLALSYPGVANAAAIGVPDAKWDERPVLIIETAAGFHITAEELRGFFEGRIARWWMPDDFVFVSRIPLGPTGKIDKVKLRESYRDG